MKHRVNTLNTHANRRSFIKKGLAAGTATCPVPELDAQLRREIVGQFVRLVFGFALQAFGGELAEDRH